MATKVLVTGANGHLGYNVVRDLVEHGYAVRAGVRDVSDTRKCKPLVELGVETVRAELEDQDSLDRATEGVEGVFHVAGVVKMWAEDAERDIVRPNVDGTLNVLRAVRRNGVRRTVLTSSMTAMGVVASADAPLDESCWNDEAETPYTRAKTEAEKLAWRFAESEGLDLVVINPATIIGPGFHRHTSVTWILELILRGWVIATAPLDTSYVDARDVARAERLAFESESASGRYLVSGEQLRMSELMEKAAKVESSVRVPRFSVPRSVLPAVVWADAAAHVLFGFERRVTKATLDEFVGAGSHCSTTKAERELAWSARPTEETLVDTFAWIRDQFF